MKFFGKELKFNDKNIYHEGNKPTPSDIGAAAASHGTHVPNNCKQITDWNSATTNGWYMANNAANAPTTGVWYFGEVIAHNSNYLMQTVYQFNASTDAKAIPKYIRAKMNGTWGAWTNVTVAKAVPSNANFSNTTYSTGTSSSSGLTKLYTGTGTATDGTMTQSAITSELNKGSFSISPEGDNRNVATTPNTYSNQFAFKGLKQGSTIGLTNATYSYLFGLRGWAESSGGKSHELAFNDNGIWTRRGATTSWEGWQKLITSHDAYFNSSVRFEGEIIKKSSGVRTCAVHLYSNPDRLEFFWSGTAGGEDWTWSNKSYISADGQIYAAKQLSAAGHRITPYSANGVSIIRPDGQEFSGLEVKELWIGPYSGQSRRLSMSASAPSGPTKGDVWIQNN